MSGGRHGLFHRDTRVLSAYRLTVADVAPELVAESSPEGDRWDAVLRVPRRGGHADGPLLPQDSLEIDLRRRAGAGLIERIAVTNHSAVPCATTLRIDLDADFADHAETGGRREQLGTVSHS